MFAQLMVFGFIFVTCGAQEHLTCLRTDELLTPSPPTPNVRTQQGRPGRRGAVGPVGPVGLKGMKGDRGTSDNSYLRWLRGNLISLRRELITVRTNLANITAANFTSALLRGYMDLAGGWVAPFNGYQYKTTPGTQSWGSSRTLCQQWGGDLAQYGVRDVATRITLYRGLSLRGDHWIGLSDSASEGRWRWLNDNRARTDDGSLWAPGRPDSSSNSANVDCAYAYFADASNGLFVWDTTCGSSLPALCEKRVDD